MEKAIITTSWDDGHPRDLKLAEMLSKYDIPATFYLPLKRVKRGCMNSSEIREISEGYDIGGHTYHHVCLPDISGKEAEKEILDGKRELEEITGRKLTAFCYPYGEYNGRVIKMVRKAGFIGARTMKSLTRRIRDPFRMGSTVYATDRWLASYVGHSFLLPDLRLLFLMMKKNLLFKGWDRVALETLDFILANGGIWHLWGHSWEIDADGDWRRLEVVLREVSSLSGQAAKLDNSQLLVSRNLQQGSSMPS
jgi:peptidoglycan/xylan/chitin deacetylase (PgdA/CDA1 family)